MYLLGIDLGTIAVKVWFSTLMRRVTKVQKLLN